MEEWKREATVTKTKVKKQVRANYDAPWNKRDDMCPLVRGSVGLFVCPLVRNHATDTVVYTALLLKQ